MALAVTDGTWKSSAPDRIEADLASLWRDIARVAPVARAVMSNLVVFVRQLADASIDLTSPPKGVPLAAVVTRHPSRVIVLHHDVTASHPNAPLAATVGVLTVGPAHARYGIEQIAIQIGRAHV